jgi:hypothetical protein
MGIDLTRLLPARWRRGAHARADELDEQHKALSSCDVPEKGDSAAGAADNKSKSSCCTAAESSARQRVGLQKGAS